MQRLPTRAENAAAMRAKRREFVELLEQVRAAGDLKTARRCEAELRKWDELMAQYGVSQT